MELWIRSQDKKILGKFNDISIRRFIDEDSLYSYQVVGYFDKDTEFEVLGEYKSFERSLEILDYIETYLRFAKNAEINNNDFLKYLNEKCSPEECNKILDNISVYEMPQE